MKSAWAFAAVAGILTAANLWLAYGVRRESAAAVEQAERVADDLTRRPASVEWLPDTVDASVRHLTVNGKRVGAYHWAEDRWVTADGHSRPLFGWRLGANVPADSK